MSEGTMETQEMAINQVKEQFRLETPSDTELVWLIARDGIVAKNGAPIRVALPLYKTGNGSPTKKGGIPRV